MRKLLSRKRCVIDSDLLQLACDKASTSYLILLLHHCSMQGIALQSVTPLVVRTERVFDILKTFACTNDMLNVAISVEYTSVFGKGKKQIPDEVVLCKYTTLRFVAGVDGMINTECMIKHGNSTSILFSCLQCNRLLETKTILSWDKSLLNSKNEKGQTSILYAAEMKQREMVLYLAGQGADITIASDDGTYLVDLIQDWKDVIDELMKVYNNIYLILS